MLSIAVVGSRTFKDDAYAYDVLDKYMNLIGPFIVVTGGAEGADLIGAKWANERKLPVPVVHPAYWDDLSRPDAVIKTRKNGRKYDALAGMRRNTLVVNDADAVIAFMDVDNPTNGTHDTIMKAVEKGIPVHIYWPGKEIVRK
jgi:hypothetical protein